MLQQLVANWKASGNSDESEKFGENWSLSQLNTVRTRMTSSRQLGRRLPRAAGRVGQLPPTGLVRTQRRAEHLRAE